MARSGSASADRSCWFWARATARSAARWPSCIAPPWEPSPALARLDIRSVDDFAAAPEVVEDADTFAGNARKKASELARALSRWVIADDSGLAVDALGGAPGVLSARYAGEPTDDEANNRKLLEALAQTPDDRRGAAFRCALALADPSGTIRLEAEGACRGRVTREPRGSGGVRLRPFVPDPRVPQDLRRAEPAGQAPAQPPRHERLRLLRRGLERMIAQGEFDSNELRAAPPKRHAPRLAPRGASLGVRERRAFWAAGDGEVRPWPGLSGRG